MRLTLLPNSVGTLSSRLLSFTLLCLFSQHALTVVALPLPNAAIPHKAPSTSFEGSHEIPGASTGPPRLEHALPTQAASNASGQNEQPRFSRPMSKGLRKTKMSKQGRKGRNKEKRRKRAARRIQNNVIIIPELLEGKNAKQIRSIFEEPAGDALWKRNYDEW